MRTALTYQGFIRDLTYVYMSVGEVSTFCGLYDLRGVYFQWCVLSTRCLISVSTLRASALREA